MLQITYWIARKSFVFWLERKKKLFERIFLMVYFDFLFSFFLFVFNVFKTRQHSRGHNNINRSTIKQTAVYVQSMSTLFIWPARQQQKWNSFYLSHEVCIREFERVNIMLLKEENGIRKCCCCWPRRRPRFYIGKFHSNNILYTQFAKWIGVDSIEKKPKTFVNNNKRKKTLEFYFELEKMAIVLTYIFAD